MKKSTLSFITLALVLVNLVLTGLLTFSLVSTNNKTNELIGKIATIIDLDVAGGLTDSNNQASSIDDIEYIDVTNNGSTDITVSYTEGGKSHYALIKVTLGINKKSRDYETKLSTINNGMRQISNQVVNDALKYSYDTLYTNKTTFEANLLKELQDLFETELIQSVFVTIVVS